MHIYYVLVFFLAYSGLSAQDQKAENHYEYKAIYRLTYQPNASDEASKTSEIMYLYLGDSESRFLSKGKAVRDSLTANASLEKVGSGSFQQKLASNPTAFDYSISKKMAEGKILYKETILMDHLQYQEELALFDWEILPEARTINGYQSQKAVTEFAGREYTAWFTSEIPIPDGPYNFNGLPGLILQIGDSEDHYVFELTEFEQLKEAVGIFSEEKHITTTKEKLLQVKEEYERDPFAAIENSNTPQRTVTIEIDESAKRKLLRKRRKELAKKNNPIELQ